MQDMLGLCSQRGIPHSNAEYAQQPVPAEQVPRLFTDLSDHCDDLTLEGEIRRLTHGVTYPTI